MPMAPAYKAIRRFHSQVYPLKRSPIPGEKSRETDHVFAGGQLHFSAHGPCQDSGPQRMDLARRDCFGRSGACERGGEFGLHGRARSRRGQADPDPFGKLGRIDMNRAAAPEGGARRT